MFKYAVITFFFAALVCSASAQEASTSLTERITTCGSISDDNQRLICFDRVNSALQANEIAPSQAASNEATKEKQRRFFGLPFAGKVKKEKNFGKRNHPEQVITQITAEISDISFNYSKANRIVLSNGQVWKQLSSDRIVLRLKRNQKYSVTIKEGALGSYRMRVEPAGKTIRVKRIK